MNLLHLLLLISPLIISIFFFTTTKQQKTRRRPPGPKGLPFIGNLHQLDVSKPHIWLTNHSKTYGPITFFNLCRIPAVVISSAKFAKEIFKNNDLAFAGRPFSTAWNKFSYGQLDIIGSQCTDYWRYARKIIVHHLLGPQEMRSFRPVRGEEVSRMIAEMRGKAFSMEALDIQETALCLTCNILCRVAFGKKFEEGTKSWNIFDGIVKRFMTSLTETFLADNLVFGWVNKIFGGDGRVENVFKEMDSFYQQLIDDHLSKDSTESMSSVLHLLIRLRGDHSPPFNLDWKHIKAILMNLFIGGIETNGVTITWAMTSLMKNPIAMRKVQEEIRSVVGIKDLIDEDDVEKLPYLKAVVKETLRLFPAIPLVPKETTATIIINGYEIDPKTLVFMNIWGIGRDPEHWENPDEFLPERFIDKTLDNFYGWVPFGFGRRICPGKNLGMATIELALANILYFFNWELPQGMITEDIDTDPAIGLVMHKKNPLFLLPKPYI